MSRLTIFFLLILLHTNNVFSKKKDQLSLQQLTFNNKSAIIDLNCQMNNLLKLTTSHSLYFNKADFDNDGIPDKYDKCPSTIGIPERCGCPEFDHSKLISFGRPHLKMSDQEFSTVLFAIEHLDFDKEQKLTEEAEVSLSDFIEILHNRKELLLVISSYVDLGSQNTNEQNMEISEQRLIEFKNHLLNHGIDEKRIKGYFFGDTMPVVDLPLTRFEVLLSY